MSPLGGFHTTWKRNTAVGVAAILVSLLSLAMLVISALHRRRVYREGVKKGLEWQAYEEQFDRPPTMEEAQEFFRRQRAGTREAE